MPAKQNALYGTVCDEIRKGLSIDKNNQSIIWSKIWHQKI